MLKHHERIAGRNKLQHSTSSTMTDNLLAVVKFDKMSIGSTTALNLYDASENAVPCADIMNQVEKEVLCPGMNEVLGADYT